MRPSQLIFACAAAAVIGPSALAWDATGHRLITQLALEGLPETTPAWLKDPGTMTQIEDQATVPDRWRSTKLSQLTHLNNPDHYLDMEDLEPYGLTLKTLPPLRYEYVKALAIAKEKAGDSFHGRPLNPARDPDKTQELPGFVPYAIVEQYGKVQSALKTVRILESLNDPARAAQLEMARQNAKYNMGIMAHFVGDGAQPLHTTRNHHGWVGENSKGYTKDQKFHSYIDGGVLRLHHIDADVVRPVCSFTVKVNARDPWNDVIAYLETTYQTVVPLYELEKSGELKQGAGKVFIEGRLAAGASMLSGLYAAAIETSIPTDKEIEEFKKYDTFSE